MLDDHASTVVAQLARRVSVELLEGAGERVFVGEAGGGGDGFHRQVGGQDLFAGMVGALAADVRHRGAPGQAAVFAHEVESAASGDAGEVVERKRLRQMPPDVVAQGLDPLVSRGRGATAEPIQNDSQGVLLKGLGAGLGVVEVVMHPAQELADAPVGILRGQEIPRRQTVGVKSHEIALERGVAIRPFLMVQASGVQHQASGGGLVDLSVRAHVEHPPHRSDHLVERVVVRPHPPVGVGGDVAYRDKG